MRERDLYGLLIVGADRDGWLLWQVLDAEDRRQPFDICGVGPDGLAVGIEVKVIDRASVTHLDQLKLRSQQRTWLMEYAKRGGLAFVLCYRPARDDIMALRVTPVRSEVPEEVGTLTRGRGGVFRGWGDFRLAAEK